MIGINTAIRANAAGIGFAIPIDTAEKAMRELSQGRKIAHAYLGISMSTLTVDSAKQNNADPNSNVELPEQPGALVLAVGQLPPDLAATRLRTDTPSLPRAFRCHSHSLLRARLRIASKAHSTACPTAHAACLPAAHSTRDPRGEGGLQEV